MRDPAQYQWKAKGVDEMTLEELQQAFCELIETVKQDYKRKTSEYESLVRSRIPKSIQG